MKFAKEKIPMKLPACSDDVLRTLFSICMVLGLNEGCQVKWRRARKIHNLITLIVLACASIRRLTQIGERKPGLPPMTWKEALFDPSVVLVSCQALFLSCGTMSALMLTLIKKQHTRFKKAFGFSLLKHVSDHDFQKARRLNHIRLGCTMFYAITWTLGYFMHKVGFIKMPFVPAILPDRWYMIPFEAYIVFISHSAILLLTIIFAHACTILRYSIKSLRLEMLPEDMDSCPLPEESLRRIREVQSRHQDILCAKTTLEENFSCILFYTYCCCVPVVCFLGFLFFKSFNECECWGLHVSLIMWMSTIFSVLLVQSLPAFCIHEEGERLLPASFKMYYDTLCEDRDLLVVSQMTLLVFQIHSARMTLCAGSYFNMSRKILLSLFSAIFTYFLILVEFGGGTNDFDVLAKNLTVIDC